MYALEQLALRWLKRTERWLGDRKIGQNHLRNRPTLLLEQPCSPVPNVVSPGGKQDGQQPQGESVGR